MTRHPTPDKKIYFYYSLLNLKLNSLLVKRQIDNPLPGAVAWGKHKRGELRHTVNQQFRGRTQRLREAIPVPDSLGEEAILIGIFTSRGYVKGQGVLISAVTSLFFFFFLVKWLRNKVICRYPGFTFQTFVYQNEYIIRSPFLKGFPFQLSKNASHTPSFINLISGHKPCRTIVLLF